MEISQILIHTLEYQMHNLLMEEDKITDILSTLIKTII